MDWGNGEEVREMILADPLVENPGEVSKSEGKHETRLGCTKYMYYREIVSSVVLVRYRRALGSHGHISN